jgi:predicted nuclease of predicted toxin-antitoxin system
MPWKELNEPADDDERAFNLEYRGKARFLVDESAGIEVARILQRNGYNAKFVEDLGLRGKSDEDVFAAAWKDKRVVITHDTDFLDNNRFPPNRNPGVVLIRPGSHGHDSERLIRCLAKAVLLARKNATWFQGKKLDFSSDEALAITSQDGRNRYLWREHGMPLIWEDYTPSG